MARGRILLALLMASAVLVGGCGSTGALISNPPSAKHATGSGLPSPGTAKIPAPAPTGTGASGDAIRVIEGWSAALRRGDVRTAAAYFGLPSEMINGIGAGGSVAVIRIHDLAQAEAANETLPCGAKFISADQRGRYVNALFRLTSRSGPGGSSCGSGGGQTARTNFLIADGRIVAWIRAPDDPGDNGSPVAPAGSGGASPVV